MRSDAAPGARESGDGCAFILDEGEAGSAFCQAPRQPGSSYCPAHHARCRLVTGSADERRRLREIEALAKVVGGKQGRAVRQPPDPLLRRLEQDARAASCPERSRIVRKEDVDAGQTTRQQRPVRGA